MAFEMALGASPRQVIAMIVSHAMRSVVIGGALGLLASLALARMLRSVLYGASEPSR